MSDLAQPAYGFHCCSRCGCSFVRLGSPPLPTDVCATFLLKAAPPGATVDELIALADRNAASLCGSVAAAEDGDDARRTGPPTGIIHVYARTYNRWWQRGRSRMMQFTLPPNLHRDLGAIMRRYLDLGGSTGNGHHAGPYEVQSDAGLFHHVDGPERSLLAWTRTGFHLTRHVDFRTWEQVEEDELAEEVL